MAAESPTLAGIVIDVIGDAIAECVQLREGIGGPHPLCVIERYADVAVDVRRRFES